MLLILYCPLELDLAFHARWVVTTAFYMDSETPLGGQSDDFFGMSGANDQADDSGPVLVAIGSLRREVNTRLDSLKHEVSQISRAQSRTAADSTELSEEFRAGLKTIRSLADELAGRGVKENKAKRGPRQTLALLPYAPGFDRAVSPLLTWAIIATVVSFVRKMPCLRFWVSQAMWTKMIPHADILNNSQGFPMVLFAAKNNSKAKMGTPPGRMWTFLLRRTLRTVIMSAKANLFRKHLSTSHDASSAVGPESADAGVQAMSGIRGSTATELPFEPDWMARFKDNASIVRAVDDSMAKFEGTQIAASSTTADSISEGPRARPRKRKKVASPDISEEHEERLFVVKQIRSMWLDKMNNGRTAARVYLYKSILFILDKIAAFKDVDRARQNGYKITLHNAKSEFEDIDTDTPNLEGTVWNIRDACVDKSPDSDSKNNRLLEELKEQFASLHATITHKKQIEIEANEVDLSNDSTRGNQYISVIQDVSFHDVAIEMVMEIHSCADSASVLTTSELSLKAVHVLAIALRGLVVSVLDQWRRPPQSLSVMESAAFGTDVSLDDDKKVPVMMEKRLKNGAISDTYNACYKDKFFISEADAEALRRDTGSRAPRTAETAPSSGAAAPSSEIGDNEPEDWIHRKQPWGLAVGKLFNQHKRQLAQILI